LALEEPDEVAKQIAAFLGLEVASNAAVVRFSNPLSLEGEG